MDGQGQEYVICFNTVNRNHVNFPVPNDCDVELKGDGPGYALQAAVAASLGSVELPTTQWTIEEAWRSVQFDQGFFTNVASGAQLGNATFAFTVTKADGTTEVIQVSVPPTVNNIISTTGADANTATFVTEYPHGLRVGSGWGSVNLDGTILQDPAVKDVLNNATLVIVDDYTFTLSNLGGVGLTMGNGYLRSSPPNPSQLAAGLTAAIQAELAMVYTVVPSGMVTYDANTNQFTFTFDDGTTTTIVMIQVTDPSLAQNMGFGMMTTLSLNPTAGSTAQTLDANYSTSACLGTLTLKTGNYTPETFAAEFERAWDPFTFDGGVAMDPALREVFAFTNAIATTYTLPIDYGEYTPQTFAQYLQAQMNAADASGQTYTVTYDTMTQQLTIASTLPFGLPFGDPVVSDSLVQRMMFQDINYLGSNSYTGAALGYAPSACSGLLRGGNLQVSINPTTNQYTLQYVGAPCQAGTVVGNTVTVTSPHGLQVGDYATLTTNPGGASFTVPVTGVTSPLVFQVNLYTSGVSGNVIVCPTIAADGALNLYLSQNPMLAELLGLPAAAVFSDSDGVLEAPFSYNFDGPPYLLLVMSVPSGSTFIKHYCQAKDQLKENIFAKLILRNNVYSIERLFPMQQVLNQNPKIQRLHLEVYNPDHSLYNFHGRNWSGTIVFLTSTQAGQQLSY